jgi:hypothetical protein
VALVAEGAIEVIQVQGPDHGPTKSLLLQVVALWGGRGDAGAGAQDTWQSQPQTKLLYLDKTLWPQHLKPMAGWGFWK